MDTPRIESREPSTAEAFEMLRAEVAKDPARWAVVLPALRAWRRGMHAHGDHDLGRAMRGLIDTIEAAS